MRFAAMVSLQLAIALTCLQARSQSIRSTATNEQTKIADASTTPIGAYVPSSMLFSPSTRPYSLPIRRREKTSIGCWKAWSGWVLQKLTAWKKVFVRSASSVMVSVF
jgi:hypothetical protein